MLNLHLECNAIATSIYSCVNTPVQYALCDYLENRKSISDYRLKLKNIYSYISGKVVELLQNTNIKFIQPQSSWYLFLNFENYRKQLSSLNITDSEELSTYLLNNFGIICVPRK